MYIDKGLLDLLSDEAARQLRELPRQDAAGTFRRLVKKALGRQTPKKDDLFWPAGLLLLGLWEAGRRETVEAYVRSWMAKNAPVSYVDDALAGYVILCLYEQTKDPQFKEAADLIREFLEDTPKDQSGAIIYGPGRGNEYIFADGAGMTALFLSKYGKVFGNAEAAALARRQIGSFLNYGMDYLSSLPYHGYDRQSGVKYGIIGWGRATGWLLMGMSGIICDTGDKEVLAAFREIIDAVFTHQRRDGLFSWQLEAMDGPADTSATAMILWSAARVMKEGRLKDLDRNLLADGADGLRRQINGGRVYGASAECIDFAQYVQQYGCYPWGQGAALAFFGVF